MKKKIEYKPWKEVWIEIINLTIGWVLGVLIIYMAKDFMPLRAFFILEGIWFTVATVILVLWQCGVIKIANGVHHGR